MRLRSTACPSVLPLRAPGRQRVGTGREAGVIATLGPGGKRTCVTRLTQMKKDIEVRDAGDKGKGVFALRAFRRGEFIFRRQHGRVVRNEDLPALSGEDRRHLCELDYRRSAVLLPPGCYLNHSCEPNAMRSGVKVFAWRRIRAGDEITIDYRLNAFDGQRYPCACGAASCPGWMVLDFFALRAIAAARVPSLRAGVHPARVPASDRKRCAFSGNTLLRSAL